MERDDDQPNTEHHCAEDPRKRGVGEQVVKQAGEVWQSDRDDQCGQRDEWADDAGERPGACGGFRGGGRIDPNLLVNKPTDGLFIGWTRSRTDVNGREGERSWRDGSSRNSYGVELGLGAASAQPEFGAPIGSWPAPVAASRVGSTGVVDAGLEHGVGC